MKTLDPKDPAEIVSISFEFQALTGEPGSPTVTIARHSGAADESDLTAMLIGSPQIVGTQIRQKLSGGVAGANYTLRCQADAPDGTRWVLAGLVPVQVA